MRRCSLLILSLFLSGSGCTGADAQHAGAHEIVGTFHLSTLDGRELPVSPDANDWRHLCDGALPYDLRITGGTLLATRDRELRFRVEGAFWCPAGEPGPGGDWGMEGVVLTRSGRYLRDGPSVRVMLRGQEESGLIDREDATLQLGSKGWRRFSSRPEPALWDDVGSDEAEAEARRSSLAPVLESMEYPYRCDTDPILAAAAPTAVRDTVGLEARLQRSLPAWRLPTERELACGELLTATMAEVKGSHPAGEIHGFATGRAWWVQRGDFDGDGGTDVLTFVVPRADASEVRVAVLFAGGSAVLTDLTALPGLASAGREVHDCDGSATILPFDGFAAGWSGTFLWQGSEFVQIGGLCDKY